LKSLIKFLITIPAKLLIITLDIYIRLLSIIRPSFGEIAQDEFTKHVDKYLQKVTHKNTKEEITLYFYIPNRICKFRANTFSTKEPETLEWIDEFGNNETVLFDIGANIGTFSLYHSLSNNGISYAFEPSPFNLRQLVKNINVNNCNELINVIPTALSDGNGIQNFRFGNCDEGGALSAFGVDFGHDGKPIKSQVSAKLLGFSLDQLFHTGVLEHRPNLLKIDVDGIEHLIFDGARETLSDRQCNTILIEVNDKFQEQADKVTKILQDCGFLFRDKRHGIMFDQSTEFNQTFNQVWVKPY